MGRPSPRLTAGVFYACVFFALAATAIGVIAVLGVRSATRSGNVLANDELETATITAQLSHELDVVYGSGQALALNAAHGSHSELITTLYDRQIPDVEAGLANLQRVHRDDDRAEKADLTLLVEQWTTLRNLLNPNSATSTPLARPALATRLDVAYQPLSRHIEALIQREDADARTDQAHASRAGVATMWDIAGAVVLAVLASISLGWNTSRRLRKAVEPARDQIDFADTLQLAQDEVEAHLLLQRHLQRIVVGATVTVLNRNNSADRLEAITPLPETSPLIRGLAQADPRSCLAVRSARTHTQDDQRPALLSCTICTHYAGTSTCTPLTVGGEVIGSVLLNRPSSCNTLERQQIRDSIANAAPVVANLRNLAIAERRAATDSLTGLPNKRAVGDTLNRMLAQASRTLSPLTLLMLDLDHFKEINDNFGHPVGDQALANVGAALRSAVRDSDFSGRNGGEEFAVLLPGTDVAGAVLTAEKIRAAIADITLPGRNLNLTASVGIAAYPDHTTTAEGLERLADAALYVAKRSGRDRVEVASAASEGPSSRLTTSVSTASEHP